MLGLQELEADGGDEVEISGADEDPSPQRGSALQWGQQGRRFQRNGRPRGTAGQPADDAGGGVATIHSEQAPWLCASMHYGFTPLLLCLWSASIRAIICSPPPPRRVHALAGFLELSIACSVSSITCAKGSSCVCFYV